MNTKKIKISELQIGMKIKTKDEYGNIVFKTVSDKFNTVVPKKDQVRLEFENGTIINCSTNHPIMVSENEYPSLAIAEIFRPVSVMDDILPPSCSMAVSNIVLFADKENNCRPAKGLKPFCC